MRIQLCDYSEATSTVGGGGRLIFFNGVFFCVVYPIRHCFICRPSDSTETEDAGIEPRSRTVAGAIITFRGYTLHTHTGAKTAARYGLITFCLFCGK
jgi:hypothetical protein